MASLANRIGLKNNRATRSNMCMAIETKQATIKNEKATIITKKAIEKNI